MKNRTYSISILGLLALSSAFAAGPGSTQPAAGQYAIDPLHSKVGFEIPHLVISTVEGHFKTFSGTIEAGKKLQDLKINGEIDVASIDTGVADRDAHLKAPDFFDAEKYPKMTFTSTKVSGTADALQVAGNLTIHGTTKPVVLKGKFQGAVKDGYGNDKVAFAGKTKISRKEYGLTWSKMVEAGPVIGDEVTIDLKIQAAAVKPKPQGQ